MVATVSEITAQDLIDYRADEGLTQAELGSFVGLDKTAIAKIESGRRRITNAESRLFQLLIHGAPPFDIPAESDSGENALEFTAEEWHLVQILAQREGYTSAREWITSKIRAYLAMTRAAPPPTIEEPPPEKKTRAPGKRDSLPSEKEGA